MLNQIDDHKTAITLTEQAIAGEVTEAEWQEALKPLLVSLEKERSQRFQKPLRSDIEQQSQQIGGVNISDISGGNISVGNIDASMTAGGDKITNIYQSPPSQPIELTEALVLLLISFWGNYCFNRGGFGFCSVE